MVVKDKKMDVVAFQRRSNCSRSPSFRINAASLSPLRLNKMRSVIVTATLLFLMMAFNIKSIYALDTSKIYFYVFLINFKHLFHPITNESYLRRNTFEFILEGFRVHQDNCCPITLKKTRSLTHTYRKGLFFFPCCFSIYISLYSQPGIN